MLYCTIKSKHTRYKYNVQKEVGITIKSIRKQVASYLPTLQAELATISACLCKHNSSWVVMYIHICTNKTHSLQDVIPILAAIIIRRQHKLA